MTPRTTETTLPGVAVIGAGMASAPHLASLRELGHKLTVAWFVGRTRERIAAAQAGFPGAALTTSLDDVLADDNVAAALVLTPPDTHLEIVSRLAAAGKHVLLEKPLDIDTGRARQIVECCEAAGVQLGVVLQHRLRPASIAMAERVQNGALGELVSAAVEMRWWRPQSYYDQPGRGTRARDGGGVLMTQGIHTLDLFLSIVGAPVELAAFAATSAAHRMECEDVVAAALRFANGATATVNATTAGYPGFPESIQVSGTLGTATLKAGRLDVQYLDGRHESLGEQQALGAGANPMDFSHQPHRAVIEDFIDAVCGRRAPRVTGASALRVHRLIDSLLQSAASRRFVAFEDTPRGA
jgi:predicted dehydrogenase